MCVGMRVRSVIAVEGPELLDRVRDGMKYLLTTIDLNSLRCHPATTKSPEVVEVKFLVF
jgi:hypothetical protein